MLFHSLLRETTCDTPIRGAMCARHRTRRKRESLARLNVEPLEERCLLASYAITDLGSFGGTNGGAGSFARAINNAGQVAGVAYTPSGTPHAFLFSAGVKIDLGTLPGFASSGGTAVNDSGQVVGAVTTADQTIRHPFLWQDLNNNGVSDPGEMKDLGQAGTSITQWAEINNAVPGVHTVQVVGWSNTAWLWQDDVMTDLNTLTQIKYSGWFLNQATGINDNQQIVGVGTISGQTHCYLWQVNGGAPTDLGLLSGGTFCRANAVNQTGQVVGSAGTATGQTHAFLRTSAVLTDLGTLNRKDTRSEAWGLNNASAGHPVQVVGNSQAGASLPRAVRWQSGNVTDLTKQLPANSGWSLERAEGVNDAGRIVGSGWSSTAGERRGFLLTPQGSSAVASSIGVRPSSASAVEGTLVISPRDVMATAVRQSSPTVTGRHTRAINSIVTIPSHEDARHHPARTEAADQAIAGLLGSATRRRFAPSRTLDFDTELIE